MAITRPLKEGSVTTYQAKVAAGFPDILASEMDADLSTIYAAWNGGVGTGDIGTGAVTVSKLDPSLQTWQTGAGAPLTPIDVTKVAAAPAGFQWGGATTKGRLVDQSGGDIQWRVNVNATPTLDDASKPSWMIRLGPTLDAMVVSRAPAGSTTFALKSQVDVNGDFTVGGNMSTGGNTAAHSLIGIRLTGTSAGIRCQGVGTSLGADGYSNAIGLGWGPNLMARVDGTALGTVNVTPPSDERLKINVQEDVPGLAAVCALRPVTFEYDQTKRSIGFPPSRFYGLIAQEAQAHVPLVIEDDGSEEHWLGLDYRHLVPVLIRAIQELAAKVGAP